MSKPESFTLTAKTDKKGRLYVVDDLGRVLSGLRGVSLNCKFNQPVELDVRVLVTGDIDIGIDVVRNTDSRTCGLGRIDDAEFDND